MNEGFGFVSEYRNFVRLSNYLCICPLKISSSIALSQFGTVVLGVITCDIAKYLLSTMEILKMRSSKNSTVKSIFGNGNY